MLTSQIEIHEILSAWDFAAVSTSSKVRARLAFGSSLSIQIHTCVSSNKHSDVVGIVSPADFNRRHDIAFDLNLALHIPEQTRGLGRYGRRQPGYRLAVFGDDD